MKQYEDGILYIIMYNLLHIVVFGGTWLSGLCIAGPAWDPRTCFIISSLLPISIYSYWLNNFSASSCISFADTYVCVAFYVSPWYFTALNVCVISCCSALMPGRFHKSNTQMAGYRGYDVTYKVLLVGDSGVGKTALIRNLMGRGFSQNHLATVGEYSVIYRDMI